MYYKDLNLVARYAFLNIFSYFHFDSKGKTLDNYIAHMGTMLLQLLCWDFVGGFYHFVGKSLIFSTEIMVKICWKYHCTITEIKHPSPNLSYLPDQAGIWNVMGITIYFVKGLTWY